MVLGLPFLSEGGTNTFYTKYTVCNGSKNNYMKKHSRMIKGFIPVLSLIVILSACTSERPGKDYPIRAVPFNNVVVQDDFWAERINTNHRVSIPVSLHQSTITGRIKNFEIAGGLAGGDFQSDAPFDDSDVFKIIEGASYSLNMFPDPELEAFIDSLIWKIGQAQEDNGYLYTWRTIHGDDSHPWIGSSRWERTHVMSHELYNMGHMYEAAVAHYRLTGKRDFLDIAIKNADLILEEIGPGKFETYPGHQGIEIGLVKLYLVTGNRDYLEQARYFLDARGHDHIGEPPFWHGEPRIYDQAHKPVTEQTEAVGHSVRALYMYAGMADVATQTGDQEYIDAIGRLWEDVTYTKLYITGGIGSQRGHEGFGPAFELPNMSAYCETCAGIANVFWNHRLFLLHGDAKYIDVMERSLYNNVLSGVALTGDRFFYPNPLESHGQHQRSEWFGCACCPSNVTRFIPSVPGYIYAQDDDNLYVNLFVSSETEFDIGNDKVGIKQISTLPWQGDIRLELNTETPVELSLHVRIPGWAQDEVVPGDLYSFETPSGSTPSINVNGESVPIETQKGYVVINREWENGDIVEMELPVDIRYITARPEVEANENRLAIQRGPLVYTAEWPDFDDHSVLDLVVDKDMVMEVVEKDDNTLGKLVVLRGMAQGSRHLEGGGTELFDKELTVIPYYAWAHRGQGQMAVWLPVNIDAARPQPLPSIALSSTISASHNSATLSIINNQIVPESSNDPAFSNYNWWPRTAQTEYIIYEFERPETVNTAQVFWFDDGPSGGCRLPADWTILYRSEGEWIPVDNITPYEITKDRMNEVRFEAVETDALRLEVRLQDEYSAGLYEWAVK